MSQDYLKAQNYGLRWNVERHISGLKRPGSTLLDRKPANVLNDAAFKMIAYALNR